MNKRRSTKSKLTLDWNNVVKAKSEQSVPEGTKNRRRVTYYNIESLINHPTHPATKVKDKPEKKFITESIYTGGWNKINMNGFGLYKMPHGVTYYGQMKDGMFHGDGTIKYPMGQELIGQFHKGKMISWKYQSSESQTAGLESYCRQPDRRFKVTVDKGFEPPPKENLTSKQPTRVIPEGCYDTQDGFYNTKTNAIHSAKDFDHVLRVPVAKSKEMDVTIYMPDGTLFVKRFLHVPIWKSAEWITENCRKAWDENVGYKPKLNEYWFSGKKSERRKLQSQIAEDNRFDTTLSDYEKMIMFFQEVLRQEEELSEKESAEYM